MQNGKIQSVTVEDSMSMVHASTGYRKAPSKMVKSEPAIILGIAEATLGNNEINWAKYYDYAEIRNDIAKIIPGFENYNQDIKAKGGFSLYNGARIRKFHTDTGKARFIPTKVPNLSLPDGQLRMMSIRSHDQYNTTIYGMNDRYRGIFGSRMIVMMNKEDMENRKLKQGDVIKLTSHAPDGERSLSGFEVVAYDMPKGCLAAYYPEVNPLIPVNQIADRSRTPMSKFVAVSVQA